MKTRQQRDFLKDTYSIKAPKTNNIQANIHASMAVRPSALGVLVVTVLKILTSTRNSVTKSAILPGMTSIGIRNEIHETITKRPKKINISIIFKGKKVQKKHVHVLNISSTNRFWITNLSIPQQFI